MDGSITALEYSDGDGDGALCTVAPVVVKIRVAMDSAAADHVLDPEGLPGDAEFEPNTTKNHFVGADDSHTARLGSCKTTMKICSARVGCNWQLAAVSRALHSVGVVCGPKVGPAKQDVLFNNEKCYVVAPGVVKNIMETISAIAEYERDGNLYIGEMIVQSSHRQGPTK